MSVPPAVNFNSREQTAVDHMNASLASTHQAGKESGGKESKLDPRLNSILSSEVEELMIQTAREFKPSSAAHHLVDGPPNSCVINYLSSESINITDLHWWTSDKHLLDTAAAAGVQLHLGDIVFAEHKVNGKSKGSVTINCRSPERASMLMHWFHCNDFQGKKIQPTYVTNGSFGKNPGYNNQRPAANVPGAAPFATNAHGGINFNRLRPLNRQPMPHAAQHGHLGMGRPQNPKGLFHKIESGQLGIQDGMQYGEWPRQAAGGWATLQSHYPSYASVDLDHPSSNAQAVPAGGLPYGDMSFR